MTELSPIGELIVNHIIVLSLLYTGPDQMIPLLSILGAIIGTLLIWWQRFVRFMRRIWQGLNKRLTTPSEVPATDKK